MWSVSVSVEMLACCCLWVLLTAVSAQSVETFYKNISDEVVLKPGPVPDTITDILWKYNGNLAIWWDGKEIDLYRHFKDRGSLNISTGEMTLTGLIQSDSGNYTADINKVETTTVILKVIYTVPVPTVSQSCNEDTTSCTLTCDGNTTGAEPVTYMWKSDNNVIQTPSMKQLVIKIDSSTAGEEFSCELENPVSKKRSEPIPNPFITDTEPPEGEGLHPKVIAGITVFMCLLVSVLLLAFVHRCKAGMWFYEKDSMPWERDFWRKSERKLMSSAANQDKKQTDEETPMT